jgi:hypothetical protein
MRGSVRLARRGEIMTSDLIVATPQIGALPQFHFHERG